MVYRHNEMAYSKGLKSDSTVLEEFWYYIKHFNVHNTVKDLK